MFIESYTQHTIHDTTHFSPFFVGKSLFCKSNTTIVNGITVRRKSTMLLKVMGKKPRGSGEMVSRYQLYIQIHSLINNYELILWYPIFTVHNWRSTKLLKTGFISFRFVIQQISRACLKALYWSTTSLISGYVFLYR